MDNIPEKWDNFDFSKLYEALDIFKEFIVKTVAAIQRLGEMVQPILETIYKYSSQISEFGKKFVAISRTISAIEKMGEAQFVFWEYMPEEFTESINDSDNINKTLREYIVRDKYKTENNIIENTLNYSTMSPYKRLYSQSAKAFRDGNSELAVVGFTTIVDGLLADISNMTTHKFEPRIKEIKRKLENGEIITHNEYAVITLIVTLEKTLDSFSVGVSFSEKEPKNLNRNWIAHGRSTRKKTKLDCIKMIHLIYGLLIIDEINKKAQ